MTYENFTGSLGVDDSEFHSVVKFYINDDRESTLHTILDNGENDPKIVNPPTNPYFSSSDNLRTQHTYLGGFHYTSGKIRSPFKRRNGNCCDIRQGFNSRRS